mgnify:CR=1 FL=1
MNNFVKWLDLQLWHPTPRDMNNAHAAWVSWCSDKRSDRSRNPFLYQLVSNTVLNRYNIITKWQWLAVNPWLWGTFWAWVTTEFAPSRALEWNITTWCTTLKVVTSTVITAVWTNMLANRWWSWDYWFKIRIIWKSAWKVEERYIVWNTAWTTPTLWLDKALTFTPTTWDTYEILGGNVFMLGAWTLAATSFRSFEVSANALTSLSNTNLPATIGTDSYMRALDEQYWPYNMEPWEGLIKWQFLYDSWTLVDRYWLTATASWASSLTWQTTLGDAVILANEYRNFQIRVVQDTVNPTAVWQRRIIASHTAWPSPVYTLWTAWAVTPSANAKYVIEYPNLLLLRSSATSVLYVYNYNKETINNGTNNIVTNAWSTTYFWTPSGAVWAWCMITPSFWIQPDIWRNAKHSIIYFFRGWNTVTVDTLDIAWAINWTWASTIAYDWNVVPFNTWAWWDYAPCDNEWRFFYINAYVASVNNQIYRFDVQNRVLSPYTPTSMVQSWTAAVWDRLTTYVILKADDEKYTKLFLQSHLSAQCYELVTQI